MTDHLSIKATVGEKKLEDHKEFLECRAKLGEHADHLNELIRMKWLVPLEKCLKPIVMGQPYQPQHGAPHFDAVLASLTVVKKGLSEFSWDGLTTSTEAKEAVLQTRSGVR